MKKLIKLFLLILALSVELTDTADARSCVAPVLRNFPLVFKAEVVAKPGKNTMSVRVNSVLSGNEDRRTVLIDYDGVAVWSQSDLFTVGDEWVFAFDPSKSLENGIYELVLCATDYLPIENEKVSANLEGSGYKEYSMEELASQFLTQ